MEPLGGAHRHSERTIADVGEALERHLSALLALEETTLRDDRYNRFRKLGELESVALS